MCSDAVSSKHPALVAKSRGIEVGGDRGQGRVGPWWWRLWRTLWCLLAMVMSIAWWLWMLSYLCGDMLCTHCGRWNHIVVTCWNLHGWPTFHDNVDSSSTEAISSHAGNSTGSQQYILLVTLYRMQEVNVMCYLRTCLFLRELLRSLLMPLLFHPVR